MSKQHCIVVFPSTHYALKGEKVAKEARIAIKMIPVPRDISPDCNMGMQAAADQLGALQSLLPSKGVECDFVLR